MENEIIIYQPDETIKLDVRFENETVWLTQAQMVILFERNQSVIARHISNIFNEGELDKKSVYAKFAYTASDQKKYNVAFYNLDVVISVGYRVKSIQGTRFRQWATKVLREHLLRGYTLNKRLDRVEEKLNEHDAHIGNLQESAKFHDRFLIIDDKELFLIGASIKDLGRKCFAFTKLDANEISRLKSRI